MNKFKYWLKTPKGKLIFTNTISILLVCIILLPFIIFNSSSSSSNNSIIAYNRDSNSGTRAAFEEFIDLDESESFSSNVQEKASNDAIISAISQGKNAIGYVSYSTIFDSEGNIKNNIKALDVNGLSPENPLYDAKRPFNVFFRVPSEEINPYVDNLVINDISIWASTGADVSSFEDEWFLSKSDNEQEQLLISYLFYNWLLFSYSANQIFDYPFNISLSISRDMDSLAISNFIENTSDLVGGYSSSLKIYSQGSTSVVGIINELFYNDEYGFINEVEENSSIEEIIYDSGAHDGSGDAFKDKKVNGNDNDAFLGFQSRGMESTEADNWGYIFSDDEIPSDGFYTYIPNPDYGNILYSTFETDILAFIINDETTFKYNDETFTPTGITTLGVRAIYLNGASWQELAFYEQITFE